MTIQGTFQYFILCKLSTHNKFYLSGWMSDLCQFQSSEAKTYSSQMSGGEKVFFAHKSNTVNSLKHNKSSLHNFN